MTAVPGDEFEDPEEAAEHTADRVYLHMMFRRAAVLLTLLAGFLAVVAADYVFAGMALFLLPGPLALLLTAFAAGELTLILSAAGRVRCEQKGRDAGLTAGQRQEAAERMRSRPPVVPWWRAGLRSSRFWAGLAVRTVYSACAGLVLASWAGPAVGAAAAAAYTVAVVLLGAGSEPVIGRWKAVVLFADPRSPRDTPET